MDEELDGKVATKEDRERSRKLALSVELRARANTLLLHALDSEMEALRERVQKLEDRS